MFSILSAEVTRLKINHVILNSDSIFSASSGMLFLTGCGIDWMHLVWQKKGKTVLLTKLLFLYNKSCNCLFLR
ncbi:MAG: hypothetical protein JWR61_1291 [Ferruginibacter sp.]|nr:hypothetical protein [Ferruginibacter sp.]